ncbi:hypothetical protein GCM10023350_35840 [Nocardioides endophyticus]|uniref:DUF3592 domain-containing protein n=1 Tax=Nocardioides endophyticus TaxID=1353775 RepID=A0ABP8Z636_9ACTN
MDIIDPAIRRRERLDGAVGDPRNLLAAGTAWGLGAVGAVGIGVFMAFAVGMWRATAVNYSLRPGELGQPWIVSTVFTIGLLMAGLGLPWGAARLDAFRAASGSGGPALALGAAGATVGVLISTRTWVAPDRVGWKVSEFSAPRAWGWGDWVLYYADRWLPALFGALTVALSLTAIKVVRAGAARARTRERLLREGVRTSASISDLRIHYSSDDNGSRKVAGATATVTYIDRRGTQRWVERKHSDASLMVRGGQVEVIYDPHQPEDDSSVFVAFTRRPAALDWV